MSKFSNRIINSLQEGLKYTDAEWKNLTKKEVKIGMFDSGYLPSKGERKLDLEYKSSDLYGVLRNSDIEIMGGQHFTKKFWIQKYGKIKGMLYFKDQVLRDRWQAIRAEERNHINVWICEPIFKDYDKDLYEQKIKELEKKLKDRGYLIQLFQSCEQKGAKGIVIYWDHESFVINKSFPTVKI